jgi:hypothetical protein
MSAPERFSNAEDLVHQSAADCTGFSDFGPRGEYQPGLRILLSALDNGPRLTPVGRELAFGGLVGSLVARLHTVHGWKNKPMCLKQRVIRPIVITGVPRTGTTVLHKLLSMDPQFQGLERWLTESPMPRPSRETWKENPHFQKTQNGLKLFFKLMPEMRSAHDMVADEVDECIEILRQSFSSNHFSSSIYVPAYDEWLFEQNELDSYRHYAKVVQLIGANDSNKRWLLKNPGHIAQLDALLDVFPDACVIQTHRDPVRAIPSLCSTLWMARRMYEGDNADARLIGPREIRYWKKAVERTMETRSHRSDQFFDVHHHQFHANPMGIVRSIYERFGLTLSTETMLHMGAYLASNPAGKHGEHRYSPEQFGLNETMIKQAFKGYTDHHHIN